MAAPGTGSVRARKGRDDRLAVRRPGRRPRGRGAPPTARSPRSTRPGRRHLGRGSAVDPAIPRRWSPGRCWTSPSSSAWCRRSRPAASHPRCSTCWAAA